MNAPYTTLEAKRRTRNSASGMTLVEVVIALALATLLCGGLYAVVLRTIRYSAHSRLATEARGIAKERIEDIISVGLTNLVNPSCTLLKTTTNTTGQGHIVVRSPRLVWHTADGGATTNSASAAYAEVHVDITYRSQLSDRALTDTFSGIVAE